MDGGISTIQQFQRLNPPIVESSVNPMVAEDWMLQMEKIHDVLTITAEQNVSFAPFMFRGEAKH